MDFLIPEFFSVFYLCDRSNGECFFAQFTDQLNLCNYIFPCKLLCTLIELGFSKYRKIQ